MPRYLEGARSAEGLKLGVVVSRFNDVVTEGLLGGALQTLTEHGVTSDQIDVVKVPGAFEIPLLAKKMALSRRYDAVICLGAVIRGETHHFEYICAEVSSGISQTALETGIPILFGVLTTDTLEQAMERSGFRVAPGKEERAAPEHKGREAALAALEMAQLMRKLKEL